MAPARDKPPYRRIVKEVIGTPPRVLVQDLGAQLDAVRSQVGAAIMTRLEGELFDLVELEVELPLPPLELFLVTHRALRRVPRVRAFMDWMAGFEEQARP